MFIDLKKAFNTVDHQLLVHKLERYGIRGIPNNLIKSYLHNRKQFVQFVDVLCGVPQGSVLGPKLFIMYIDDISTFILFADDTYTFRNGSDLDGLCIEISIELDKFNIWFDVNKLSLNVSKTNYIVFGKKSNSRSVLMINGYEIERANVSKFLGVMTDEKLDWKIQIATVKNKLEPQ